MFDCQEFLKGVYAEAFQLGTYAQITVTGRGSQTWTIDPVSGGVYQQAAVESKFPLVTWTQSGSLLTESVDSVDREAVQFDVSVSTRKRTADVILARELNAFETALLDNVNGDSSITIESVEPDEDTINDNVRSYRNFTLTIRGLISYDGVLDETESRAIFG